MTLRKHLHCRSMQRNFQTAIKKILPSVKWGSNSRKQLPNTMNNEHCYSLHIFATQSAWWNYFLFLRIDLNLELLDKLTEKQNHLTRWIQAYEPTTMHNVSVHNSRLSHTCRLKWNNQFNRLKNAGKGWKALCTMKSVSQYWEEMIVAVCQRTDQHREKCQREQTICIFLWSRVCFTEKQAGKQKHPCSTGTNYVWRAKSENNLAASIQNCTLEGRARNGLLLLPR